MSYVESALFERQLKVQSVSIPFYIEGNEVPGDKVVIVDELGLLFFNVQGIDGITVDAGAFDTTAEKDAVTFTAADDGDGKISGLFRVGEQVTKVMSVKVISRAGSSNIACATFPTGATAGITSLGDKIVFNLIINRVLEVGGTEMDPIDPENADYCLVIEYIASNN